MWGFEQSFAGLEILTGGADVCAAFGFYINRDIAFSGRGVFLNHDSIGASRDISSGEDPHRFARVHGFAPGVASGGCAYDA